MILSGGTCKELLARVRSRIPANHGLTLGFAGCLVQVTSSSRGLKEALADYFQEFLCDGGPPAVRISLHESEVLPAPFAFAPKPPSPGKTVTKEEWVDFPDGRMVRKRLTGMLFLFGGGEHLAVGPCLANTNQVINFINNRFIEWKLGQGSLLGHGAGVVAGNRGLAVAGVSGSGKSTLALHLMAAGARFVSNDRLMVMRRGEGLEMCGVAKHPRINPGTALTVPGLSGLLAPGERARFMSLPRDVLKDVEEKHDVPIHRFFGPGRFALTAPLCGLVILNWSGIGSPTAVRSLEMPRDASLLSAFAKDTGLFYGPFQGQATRAPTLSAYADLLAGVPVVELSGGRDFVQGTKVCLAMLSP